MTRSSAPPDDPQLDDELARALAGDTPLPALDDLDAARARIHDDLVTRQGPFREKGPLAQSWPALLAGAIGVWLMFLWPGPSFAGRPVVQVAAALGTLAVLLCVLATVVAPRVPGVAERVSMVGLVIAVLALGAEGVVAARMGGAGLDAGGALRCGGMLLGLAIAPMVLLGWNLWRSGLPGRFLHLTALSAAGLAIAGVAMWRHCAAPEALHIVVSHVALPAIAIPVLAWGLFRLGAPRSRDP